MDIGATGKAVAPPQAEQSQRLDTAPREAEATELPAEDTVAAIDTDTTRVEAEGSQTREAFAVPQSNRAQLSELRFSTTLVAANLDPTIIEWGTLDESTERRLAAQDAYPPINAANSLETAGGPQASNNESVRNSAETAQATENISISRLSAGFTADVTA